MVDERNVIMKHWRNDNKAAPKYTEKKPIPVQFYQKSHKD
jgi:hypothetical protein